MEERRQKNTPVKVEQRSGVDRRKGDRRKGHIVTSRSRTIVGLAAAAATSSFLALVSLVISTVIFFQRLDFIQDARAKSAGDSCLILRKAITTLDPGVNPAVIHQLGLSSCVDYARKAKEGSPVRPK